jgi:hypothetical protein
MLLAIAAEFHPIDVDAVSFELDDLARPLALAVLAAELGRRAGLSVGVCSTPTGPVRRHCGHEVGFAALTGVYARMIRDGDSGRACRAAHLRGRLPVGRHVA